MSLTAATMDSIKKKMASLVNEKNNAVERTEQMQAKFRELEEKLRQKEEESSANKKRMSELDAELDQLTSQIDADTPQLAESEARVFQSEGDIASLQRRILLAQEESDRVNDRLSSVTAKLNDASQTAEEKDKLRKALEIHSYEDDAIIADLEQQLSDAQLIAIDADRKYDE
ncbi:hypothetical protein GJ496_011041, partial [Pomphorhynchus laevis]